MKFIQTPKYYVENPIKFRIKPRFLDQILRGLFEVSKTILARIGMMKPEMSERLFERPFVLNSLPNKKPLKILDLGCGDSIFPLELRSLGHEVWGSDPKDYPFYKKITFVKGDFTKLEHKFPKNYFDTITCVSAIEHFGLEMACGDKTKNFNQNRKDIEAIQICRRILKKNGLLFLTVPYGKKQMFEFERVYDEAELSKLTLGFKLIKKRIIQTKNELIDQKQSHPSVFMGIFAKS